MSMHEVFANAPIREAIIDIQFESTLLSLELIEVFIDEVADEYDFEERAVIRDHKFKIQLENDGASSYENSFGILGFKVCIKKMDLVIQFKTNGFAISQIGNYKNWDYFSTQAKQYWNLYSKRISKLKLKRLAVRYINDLSLPVTNGLLTFSDYLTIEPKTPTGLPNGVSKFFSTVEIPCNLTDTYIVIIQALQGQSEKSLNVLLDFDVYTIINDDLPEIVLWQHLEKLRDIKNYAFEGSITETCKELFR